MIKKIFLLLVIMVGIVTAQVFDNPIDSTKHYSLRLYAQSARSSAAVLNADKETIDSVLYSLIIWTDTLQFVCVTDTSVIKADSTDPPALVLKISNYSNGERAFTGTAILDSIVFTDSVKETSDVILLTPYSSTITSNDILSYTVLGKKAYVHRPSGGTSGLKYVWRRIKRY